MWRRLIGMVIAAVLAAASLVLATPVASASAGATVKATTQRMVEASLNTTQAGSYGAGSHLTLSCYSRGQAVKGYYSPWIPGGFDNLWYRVSDGYWVADVDLSTGSNNPVAPACSESTRGATVMATTQRVSGPSLTTKQVGTYGKGLGMALRCYARGQSVKGYYSPWISGGWDNLWYMVTDGYWVADVDVSTGVNGPVTRACGSNIPVTPPPPAPTYHGAAAATWAAKNANTFAQTRFPYNIITDCTRFVSTALWEGGGLPKTRLWTNDSSDTSLWGSRLRLPRWTKDALNAADFTAYMKSSGTATVSKISWSDNTAHHAQLGDVIAYNWYGAAGGGIGGIDHVAIVTSINAQGYPSVTQHTPTQVNRYWSWSLESKQWIQKKYPKATAWLIHITR